MRPVPGVPHGCSWMSDSPMSSAPAPSASFPLRARLDVRAADGVVELHVGPYAVVDLLSVFDVGAESAGGYDNRFRVHGDLLASAVHGRQTSDGAVF
jgi:hypothetical protein